MNAPDKLSGTRVANPRVSVISIFLNEEVYLAEAIESILAQDFDDYELILVDDGSTDTSSMIAKSYSAKHPERISYLQHPDGTNQGMSSTRNLGLQHARGEFIAFIDADDRWYPSKLREQVALLDRLGAVDAIGGTVNYWSSHAGGKDRLVRTAHVRNRLIKSGEATLKLYPLGRANAPSMSDLMFRRRSIDKVGGFEEAFTGAYEDQAFLAKFYLNSTMYISDTMWSDYRLHDQSCMANVRRNGTYDHARRAFLHWFERHLDSEQIAKPEHRRAVQRELRRSNRRSLRERLADSPLGPIVHASKATLRRIRPPGSPGPAILMYHRIADEKFDPWELAVSPLHFEDQLRWISTNRTVFPLSEFAERHRAGALPKDAIALTFDDGYACNVQVAGPLLEQYGVPATVFLSTELIERGEEFWWDKLETLVMEHSGSSLCVDGEHVELGRPDPRDSEWPPAKPASTPRQSAYRRIWSILHPMAPGALSRAMSSLRQQSGCSTQPRDSHRPMTAEEVRNAGETIDFGSHAVSHASLPLLNRKAKHGEINDSIEACAAITGRRPVCFAFPYGNSDRETEDLVEAAGFTCACKANGGFVTKKSSRFALPRMLVGNWNSAKLARRLGRP